MKTGISLRNRLCLEKQAVPVTEEELYAVNGGAGKVHAIFDGSVDENGKFSGGKFSVGFEFEF